MDLAALAEKYDAWLMTDDAHGIGVVGEGRGSSFVTGTKASVPRSEAHTSELQSLMRSSYAVFCLKKNKKTISKAIIVRAGHVSTILTHTNTMPTSHIGI